MNAAERFNRKIGLLILILVSANRKQFWERMNKTLFIQHRVLIRIILRAHISQYFDESSFPPEAFCGHYYRLPAPRHDSGMQKNTVDGKLGDRQTNLPIEVFENKFLFISVLDFLTSPEQYKFV
jgi:hypothetical protein